MTYSEVKACLDNTDTDTLRDLIERFGAELVYKYQDEGYSLNEMNEAYQGEYKDDEDFAYELCNEIYDLSPPNNGQWHPAKHIDWSAVASNLMYDYHEVGGHYFRLL